MFTATAVLATAIINASVPYLCPGATAACPTRTGYGVVRTCRICQNRRHQSGSQNHQSAQSEEPNSKVFHRETSRISLQLEAVQFRADFIRPPGVKSLESFELVAK